jgi:hypothetical protein
MSDITPTKSRHKPMCVICQVPLYKGENEDYQWICPKDKSHKYQIFAEVMSYDNNFSTIFSEEEENQIQLAGLEGVGEPLLLTEDEFKEESHNKPGSIPIPKYFKDSETTKVTEYHEE